MDRLLHLHFTGAHEMGQSWTERNGDVNVSMHEKGKTDFTSTKYRKVVKLGIMSMSRPETRSSMGLTYVREKGDR